MSKPNNDKNYYSKTSKVKKTSKAKLNLFVPVEKDDDSESLPLVIEFTSEQRGLELVHEFNTSTNAVFTDFIEKVVKETYGKKYSIDSVKTNVMKFEKKAGDNEKAHAFYEY
jgi:hypothetical protein